MKGLCVSEKMRLHWSPRSPFVRKVVIAAHETGLFDQLQLVRTAVAFDRPNVDLLPDNPLNKIPTLVLADHTALYDSFVICDYFNRIAGGDRLIPAAADARQTALHRHALGNGFLDLLILFRNERDRAAGPSQPHLAAYATKRAATLTTLEREIDDLPRDRFGIDHIAIGCALSYLDFRFSDMDWRADYPALARWQAEFDARPSVAATRPTVEA
jgi:glutathione S-transferase